MRRSNFKIPFCWVFFFPSGDWTTGFLFQDRQATRPNPQSQIIKIPCPAKPADHYKHWRQPHKLKMSQPNCSIAIVTFKVLNWKTILMFCRTCVGWNTWKNWLQGGKCNPAHVYFWLLQDTKPNKGFLCPFLCHGQKFAGVSHSAASRCCTGQPCKAPIHWTLSLHLCALYGKENRENKEAVML